MSRSQILEETRPVGARVPKSLYIKFKSKVAELDFKIQDVIVAMIRLFLDDEGFRDRVLQELRGGDGV